MDLNGRSGLPAKVPQNGLLQLAFYAIEQRPDHAVRFFNADLQVRIVIGEVKIVPGEYAAQRPGGGAITQDQDAHPYLTNRTFTLPVPEVLCR